MQRRKDLSQIQELGELVFNMCKIVPGGRFVCASMVMCVCLLDWISGVICFFCSYDFEDFVLREVYFVVFLLLQRQFGNFGITVPVGA